jgi:hypothetical protein
LSNVIDFLERMGQDARLREATGAELDAALTQAGIEPALRTAMFVEDSRALESLLGVTPSMCCLINKEDEEEDEPDEEEEDDEEEEEDEEDYEDDEDDEDDEDEEEDYEEEEDEED